jgi:hypothetical protein
LRITQPSLLETTLHFLDLYFLFWTNFWIYETPRNRDKLNLFASWNWVNLSFILFISIILWFLCLPVTVLNMLKYCNICVLLQHRNLFQHKVRYILQDCKKHCIVKFIINTNLRYHQWRSFPMHQKNDYMSAFLESRRISALFNFGKLRKIKI